MKLRSSAGRLKKRHGVGEVLEEVWAVCSAVFVVLFSMLRNFPQFGPG